MRKAGCCLVLACVAAFGQGAPAQAPTAQSPGLASDADWIKATAEFLRRRIEPLNLVNPPGPQLVRLQGAPVSKPGVCAIPLLHVVPPGTTDKMTVAHPPNRAREDGGTVKVSAPACDEHLFTNGPSLTPAPAPRVEPQVPKQ